MTEAATVISPQLSNPLKCKSFSAVSDLIYFGDSRLDATNYAEEVNQAMNAILATRASRVELGQLCETIWHPVQNQARSNFKRIYVAPEHGVPYVGSREMFFFPLHPKKFLSRRIPKLQDLMVPQGWLLVSRSGTIGNVLYVYDRLSKCAITDDAIRIEPTSVLGGYLYAFLASKYGQPFLSRGSYGSTVDHLEPKHLASIPVPIFDNDKQQQIHEPVIRAYALRDQANRLAEEAEMNLYDLLGIKPFSAADVEYLGDPALVKAFEVESTDLSDRFDATNHVPIVRSMIHKLQNGKRELTFLGQLCSSIVIPPRFKRNYVEQADGVKYLLPAQLPLIRSYGIKAISPKQAKESPEYLLTPGQLLITTDGTVGRVHPVSRGMAGWFGSNNMARLWDSTTDMGYLYAFLATPYGHSQICKPIYGGVIDHINESHIASVLVPMAPVKDQHKIGDKVREAFELRDAANDLEDYAINRMEALIGRPSDGRKTVV